MYTRVTFIQTQPGKVAEVAKIFNESVRPTFQSQHGFRGFTFLTNAAEHKIVGIGYWESEADITAIETNGFYQTQIGKVRPFLAAPPVRETYKVAFRESSAETPYIRLTIVQVQEGKIADAVNLFNASVIPATRQQEGFESAVLLTNDAAHKALAVGFWESEAALVASEANGYYQEQFSKAAHIIAAAPVSESYQLSV